MEDILQGLVISNFLLSVASILSIIVIRRLCKCLK